MGDPGRVAILETILKTVQKDNLIDLNLKSGKVLLEGLEKHCKDFPGLINSARGLGTYCAFDAVDSKTRDLIAIQLRNAGMCRNKNKTNFQIFNKFGFCLKRNSMRWQWCANN